MASYNPKSTENRFRDLCRTHNLRITPQRLGIFKLLVDSKEHPNAEVVYRKIRKTYPNISFDTVNRTLLTFARIGVLKIVEGSGVPKRFDPNMEKHHHFHCIRCNRIIDFFEDAFDRIEVPKAIARRHNVMDKKVVLEGICEKCK